MHLGVWGLHQRTATNNVNMRIHIGHMNFLLHVKHNASNEQFMLPHK